MSIVSIAIVRGANSDNGFQRWRAVSGHLQGIEAAPGNTEHPHFATAPGLLGNPVQHSQAVILLLLRVFILDQSIGVARPLRSSRIEA